MKLEFAKLNGLGNDFVFVDDLSEEVNLTREEVARICDRRTGIGADGVILVRPSENSECTALMYYINSDGTLAQMCGNGVRCFSKYLVDRGYASASEGKLVADTLSGPKHIDFQTDEGGLMTIATVNMGEPILDPAKVPVDAEGNAVTGNGTPFAKELPLSSPWGDFEFTCVSMGNPHAVCFVDDWDAIPDELFTDPNDKSLATFNIDPIGSFYESNPIFPEKANIEFAEVKPDGIHMRVYERGCGETHACGTGACATNVAAVLCDRAPRENDIILKGGTLHIAWDDSGDVYMTGPAEESFTGSIEIG